MKKVILLILLLILLAALVTAAAGNGEIPGIARPAVRETLKAIR